MSLQHILSSENLSILIPLVFYISFFLTLSTLALFVESAIVLRTLVLGRARPVHYALLGLPLGASILSFIVAMAGWQAYYDREQALSMIFTHLSLNALHDILLRFNSPFLSISIIGLLLSALVIVVFALTIFLEKKLLPRMNRRPLWTVVRRQRVV